MRNIMIYSRVIFFFSIFFFFLFISCSSQEIEIIGEDRYSQNLNKIGLKYESEIALAFEDSPALGQIGNILEKENSFVIIDRMANKIYEFGKSGRYLKTIGRKGDGIGEYKIPMAKASALDAEENLYNYDGIGGHLNVYDKNGEFIESLNPDMMYGIIHRIHIDVNGNLLLLVNQNDGISRLTKVRKDDLDSMYSLRLTTPKVDSMVWHMNVYAAFCYNQKLGTIYHMSPVDYRIKEVDTHAGRVVREFGKKPDSYKPMSSEFYNMGMMRSSKEMVPIVKNTSIIWGNTLLIDDKYLLLCHSNEQEIISALVYDVENLDDLYELKEESVDIIRDSSFYTAIKDKLYVYRLPPEEDMDFSNGTITIYSLNVP